MRFEDLGIESAILRAIAEMGYTEPTPIQVQSIRPIAEGRDLLGCAQTGTGKTAAFSIPILQRLGKPSPGESRPVRALILTPTRELALQIYENLCQYGRYTGRVPAVIYGGVSQIPQVEALRRGADILVATPGRLWDLMGQGLLDIGRVECFVLDEADRMLDMGFIHDVKRIIEKLPRKRQTLLFSATMPDEITDLANSLLHKPVHVSITPSARPVDKIEQGVYFAEKKAKRELLQVVLRQRSIPQTLVFTRTKHGADRVARDLNRAGIPAKSIHGDKSQGARQTALSEFKNYKIAVLVATDIAARGIDINELPLVINFDLPNVPETYVHRIGRTGRAGMEGTALSFCDASELPYLADIEKVTGIAIPALEPPAGITMTEASAAARYVASDKPEKKEKGRGKGRKQSEKTEKQSIRAAKASKEPKPEKAEKPAARKPRGEKKTAQSEKPVRGKAEKPEKAEKPIRAMEAEKSAKAEKSARTPRGRRRVEVSEPQTETKIELKPEKKSRKAERPAKGEKKQTERGRAQEHRGGRRTLPARGRRGSREPDTRVDISTEHSGSLSESTAARIRAKVEAKLAERRSAQAAAAKPAEAQTEKKRKVVYKNYRRHR